MLTGLRTCTKQSQPMKKIEAKEYIEALGHREIFDSGGMATKMATVMLKLLPLCQMPTIAASNGSEIHGVGELPPPYVFAWQKKKAKPVKEGMKKWRRLPKSGLGLHESQQPEQPMISSMSRSRALNSQ